MMRKSAETMALDAVIGLIAGVVATGPMTVAMILAHRRLPFWQRYSLPPREITMKLAREAGLSEKMNSEARAAATLVGHFGYGGMAGAVYGAVSDRIPGPGLCKGVGAGLLLWLGSYLGWLPAAGILKSATEHPVQRNLLMIGAHVVWGATLGVVADLMKEEVHGESSKPFSSRATPHLDL